MTTAIGAYATPTALKQLINVTDTNDDTLLGLICDRVNDWIEETTRRCLAPIASATYLYDGDNLKSLYLPRPASGELIGGIRALTTVELAYYTTAPYITIALDQFFLRQRATPSGPFERLVFTDYPIHQFVNFPKGMATVRITGTAGWDQIPDEITELALTIASRVWSARQSGQTDIAGTDELGRPLITRFVAGRDRDTLRRYTIADALV